MLNEWPQNLFGSKDEQDVKEKKDKNVEKNSNCGFSILYIGTSAATIIIIASGGPASLVVSAVLGVGFTIYYANLKMFPPSL